MNARRTRRRGRRQNRLMVMLRSPLKPVWMLILIDVLAVAIAINVFALFHHVIPRKETSLGIQTVRKEAPAVQATSAPAIADESGMQEEVITDESEVEATESVAPAANDHSVMGDFSALYPDKFTATTQIVTENTLQSPNLNITINEYYNEPSGGKAGQRYYVADIYIKNIECFQTAFAKDTYGKSITESIAQTVYRHNSVLTMNGDFYGLRHGGICIRNGVVYHSMDVVRDICVLYWDGTLESYKPEVFDADLVISQGAYQCWNFGPGLLDENGEPRHDYASFYEDVYGNQPRAALGYYAPGHYCFIACDGRSDDSRGFTIDQLALLAQSLGLTQCYNMDGGQTAELAFCTSMVNVPAKGGRNCSDYLCIIDGAS